MQRIKNYECGNIPVGRRWFRMFYWWYICWRYQPSRDRIYISILFTELPNTNELKTDESDSKKDWPIKQSAPASEGIAVEEPQNWCPICNMPDDDTAWCRCDYPTVEELVELLRKIYRDAETTEKIKQLIEELFRPWNYAHNTLRHHSTIRRCYTRTRRRPQLIYR